jgi:hypothetical protein
MDGERRPIEALDWERRPIEATNWEGRPIDRRLLRDHLRLTDSPRAGATGAWRAVTLAASALGVEHNWRGPRVRRHEEKHYTEPRHRTPCCVLYNDPI